MDSRVSIAVLGAGSRGFQFADIFASLPERARVVAVAEPRKEYREEFASRHDIPPDRVFPDWRDFCARPRMCDAVVVSTMDRDHVGPAVACTRLGYHMLLEKPMATTLEDCGKIARAQKEKETTTCVCHSLRYNASFAELKRVVESGRIGRIITVDQLEQVAWWHQAHSFVRGNWANEGRSAFMLLSKSCHDIDYIAYLVAVPCRRVSSFGSLSWFRRENAPAGSAERCTSCGVERSCPYSSIKLYVDAARETWPAAVVSLTHDREAHLRAVENGPYGRCVWKCDNDVVDHQVVAMEFEGGTTATFTMTAFTQEGGRKIRVHGTDGEIEFTEDTMEVRTFADRRNETIVFPKTEGGHGGGDERVVESFLAALIEKRAELVVTDVQESLRTHSIVFAAERSRRMGKAVEVE